MEKNMASGSTTQPTAPPPSAPPSYEEAVANIASPPPQSNIPPYPVGPPVMPVPTFPPTQTTAVFSPNYPGAVPANVPHLQHQTHYTANYQPVTVVLGRNPVKMTCPKCHQSIKTTIISDHQPSAHICCIVLCLLGCCLCSCLPYCMSSFMNVHHICPNCKQYIGRWKG
ncbi:lipopolysaccharide-induced tumor necrosis factor-alpha factor homolog [Hylaeus anthracinus]|uniref:lipopolysaccharide-induced tumor necrosis factor-alpha factor homolog n=1 Tax=Hylaeus anthracinus TaxID=313031 RepID=UPI0023BA1D1A|nr:lipopolysaccharide-induced tumor necrosis factor-alpha factor homolog [Hylaeus anthracinus]XP_053997036.1 lipopolysaccharide-induced tumor necrosis factor-alpha factor homolog [Hylaeus anthracinus]